MTLLAVLDLEDHFLLCADSRSVSVAPEEIPYSHEVVKVWDLGPSLVWGLTGTSDIARSLKPVLEKRTFTSWDEVENDLGPRLAELNGKGQKRAKTAGTRLNPVHSDRRLHPPTPRHPRREG